MAALIDRRSAESGLSLNECKNKSPHEDASAEVAYVCGVVGFMLGAETPAAMESSDFWKVLSAAHAVLSFTEKAKLVLLFVLFSALPTDCLSLYYVIAVSLFSPAKHQTALALLLYTKQNPQTATFFPS